MSYNGQEKRLTLQVVQGNGPSLLGRDWLGELCIDWPCLHKMTTEPWRPIIDSYAEVFKDEAGHIKGHKSKLHLKPGVQPRFFHPRNVPYSQKEKVEMELTRLEEAGVIEKITCSDWAAPIVPVVKRDGSIRVCGDYKLTANVATVTDSYPLPKI